VALDEETVIQSFGTITEFGIPVVQIVLLVSGDAVIGMQQVVEYHVEGVA
jgi:hypothetical protein